MGKAGFICLCGIVSWSVFGIMQAAAGVVLITSEEAKLPPPKDGVPSRAITRGPKIELLDEEKGQLHSPINFQVRFKSYGGANLDLNSLQVIYLRSPNVDLTSRVKPFADQSGIAVPDAELPPGEHAFQVQLKDSDGRAASKIFILKIIP